MVSTPPVKSFDEFKNVLGPEGDLTRKCFLLFRARKGSDRGEGVT